MATTCTHLPLREQSNHSKYSVSLAHTEDDVFLCQRLRHKVFSSETLSQGLAGNGVVANGQFGDRFDPHCKHLIVRDLVSGKITAATRILTDEDTARTGMFFAETEFDLSPVMGLNGRFMEVGRIYVAAQHDVSAVLTMLWHGIAQLAIMNKADYLIGCANMPIGHGDHYVQSVLAQVQKQYSAPQQLQAKPLVPLPQEYPCVTGKVTLPPVVRSHLQQGARVCGDAYWDAANNLADLLMLLECDQFASRYAPA